MNDPWQNNLRDLMERHEEPAPEGLWNEIEQIIRAEEAVKIASAGKKNSSWAKYIGVAAAVALILVFVGLHLITKNQDNVQFAGQNKSEQTLSPKFSDEKEVAPKMEEPLLAHNRATGKPQIKKPVQLSEAPTYMPEIEETDKAEEQPQPKKADNTNRPDNPTTFREKNSESSFQLPGHRRNRDQAKWQAGVYAANIPSAANKRQEGYRSFAPFEYPSEEDEYALAAAGVREDIRLRSQYQHPYTDIKHLQPITFGASVKYNFTKNFGVASGVTYTLLSSQLQSGSDYHYYSSQQTLHYIGFPLNVTYTVWRNDKISTYVSAGALVEKNVTGSLSTNYYIDNKIESSTQKELSEKQLQWSVNSSVGIQYDLSRNIGIYAEPGVAYYFKNESELETIYKEKPLNFNIRLGVRFSFNEQ